MIADIAELELSAGARAGAQVAIDTNDLTPGYSLRGRVENLETGPVTSALFGSAVLSGRSTLALDVTSYGETPIEVMRRLSGKASLTMPEGCRLAFDVKALRGAAKADASSGWGALAKGQTSLDQVEMRALLRNGVLFADAVRGSAGGLGLGATGSVDIVDKRLDLSVAMKPNVPTDRPITSGDLAGGETVRVSGSWHEPVVGGRKDGALDQPN
jgi:hypothetical protein